MVKKLIVSVNSKYVHSSLAPWYLKAMVADCEIYECTINNNVTEIFHAILEKSPQIVGFSCYIWNISVVNALISLIREHSPSTIIILGGPEVSFNPGDYLALCDFVICGEGEQAFLNLCQDLEQWGLSATREKGQIIKGHPIMPPNPYSDEYLATLRGRLAYIETSRNCPFSCAFCLSGRDDKVTYLPLDRAKADILTLSRSGAKTIKFVDRTFNAHKDRALDLWSFIKDGILSGEIPKNVCFHFEIAADLLDERHISLLNSMPTGRVQLEIGLQSFNQQTLDHVMRKTNLGDVCKNIQALTKYKNIHIHVDLIAGLPFEDLYSFSHSFDMAFSLNAHMVQVGFLKLLHGSALRRDAGTLGIYFSPHAPYEVAKTPNLSGVDLAVIHTLEQAVERVANSGKFPKTLEYLLAKTGLRPYDLFLQIGQNTPCGHGHSLDALVFGLFTHFNYMGEEFFDCLIWDKLSTDNTGFIPIFLRTRQDEFKNIRKALEKLCPQEKGVRRGLALLNCGKTIYADYKEKDPITGVYTIKEQVKE